MGISMGTHAHGISRGDIISHGGIRKGFSYWASMETHAPASPMGALRA